MSIDVRRVWCYTLGMAEESAKLKELVLSREEVRRCDRVAMERFEINGLVLMENAGIGAVRLILSLLKDMESPQVSIVAGTGNNGGDGFVVARHLSNEGISVKVLICGSRDRIKGDAVSNLRIIEHMGLPIAYIGDQPSEIIEQIIGEHTHSSNIIVDGMLGTGTSGTPRGAIRSAIEAINKLNKTVVALDIPSGLDCDTGKPLERAVRAQYTVTFAARKKGFENPAVAEYTGRVFVVGIGIHT